MKNVFFFFKEHSLLTNLIRYILFSLVTQISTLFFQMVMFKSQKEEVTQLQAHFKKNQKIREYSSHISKVHSVDWSSDGSKYNYGRWISYWGR